MRISEFSLISILSCIVSILGTVLYGAIFSNGDLVPIFVIVSLLSIVLPLIAKKLRLNAQKKGGFFEIVAIVIGGFNFYCIIFALTKAPIFIAYLGWLVCGIIYKLIKAEENKTVESSDKVLSSENVEKKVEIITKNYDVCIFDVTTNTLRKEKKNIDVTKFPPSKFADNNTYYAIETFRNGKKIRIYHTKDNWDRQKGIERQETGLLEETNIDGNVRKQGISHKEQIMILCKQCGTEILSDSIFCRKCGTKVEDINKEFFICIFDATTHNLRKEKKNIDVTKIPPSKFADNDTYYAIETFKDGKKIRTYLTKDNWNKQIEIGISE